MGANLRGQGKKWPGTYNHSFYLDRFKYRLTLFARVGL